MHESPSNDPAAAAPATLRLSDVVSALSYALDIVEGQPEGHAVRTCMIGMRIAKEIYLSPRQRSALFYALLLKDLGCSSNASKVCYLFGADDRTAKCDLKTHNWTKTSGKLSYIVRNVAPNDSLLSRVGKFIKVARAGAQAARELTALRCDRGATIARMLLMPDETQNAIRCLDEHWDGQGHPVGLQGEEIPILARIAGLAQTAEVFYRRDGLDGAMSMAQSRAGSWFDPELVKALLSTRNHWTFWDRLHSADIRAEVMSFEPEDKLLPATEEHLDCIATGFSHVIDAKSPWTFRHSEGVSQVATGLAAVMGFDPAQVRRIRRAALLHDIGKLGVSNLILDKPGKLNPDELEAMRKHPAFSRQILQRVPAFADIADLAAAHHERLDGKGYDRGLPAEKLSTEIRILSMADMFEALAARRPYREDLTEEQVMDIVTKTVGTAIDPACFEALKVFLEKEHWTPIEAAA